jgi:DNA (cytosine-5)-methyltransferase 1
MATHDSWEPGTPIEKNAHNWEEEPHLRTGRDELPDGLRMVDLFCGCGGFSAGFRMADIHSVLGLDIHPPSLNTFQNSHPWANAILGDIREVDLSLIEESLNGDDIDVITAGVPCQGFSRNNRKRHDEDDRNFLFREFIRVSDALKPPVILLENVSGLKSAAGGGFANAIGGAMEEIGYSVKFVTLNAADYGVPQTRKRVFFLGTRDGVEVRWPKKTHGSGRERGHVGVWEAIGDLPQIEAKESTEEYDRDPFTQYQEKMRGDANTVHNHIAPKHPSSTVERIAGTEPGEPMYERFKQRIRLHPDQPSPTQVSGGIRPQFQFGHPKIPRGLTVRERCRIQSFPDHYEIKGGVVQGRYQTGNAVPPILAHAIADEIRKGLQGNSDEPLREEDRPVQSDGSQMVLFES